eukprot:419422-Pleurochrysis_carterae.AAC.1
MPGLTMPLTGLRQPLGQGADRRRSARCPPFSSAFHHRRPPPMGHRDSEASMPWGTPRTQGRAGKGRR